MPDPTTPRPDVPDELIKLAEDADSAGRQDHCRRYGSWKSAHPDQLARILAAVLPAHERQVREQVAAEQTRAQKVVQFLEREIAAGNRIAVVEPSGRVVRIELAPDAGRGKS